MYSSEFVVAICFVCFVFFLCGVVSVACQIQFLDRCTSMYSSAAIAIILARVANLAHSRPVGPIGRSSSVRNTHLMCLPGSGPITRTTPFRP